MADLQPMVVFMYTRSRGYGFCAASSEDAQVYFHADVFHRTMPQEPPPIVGEAVQVEVSSNPDRPKAIRVLRAAPPSRLVGEVKSFDPGKGWGFIQHESGSYFLHRSEMEGIWVPVRGSRVSFYPGMKDGQPRACHVGQQGTLEQGEGNDVG